MDSDKYMFEPPATEEDVRIWVSGKLSFVQLRFWVKG